MKRLLCSLLVASSLQIANAKEASVSTPTISKVVELHITFAPPPDVQTKKVRKLMFTKSGRAICSGSFITSLGLIITAKHCVEGTEDIEVETSDGQIYTATVLAKSHVTDLALIEIGRSGTPYYTLGGVPAVGDPITMIGSPLGYTRTQTQGIVSKLLGDYTMLDCTGVPGNSGGPVINAKGELVGVVSAMIVVIFGPAHLSIINSADAVGYFLYSIASGR